MDTYSDAQLAQILCRTLADYSVAPTSTYRAAAGSDYGCVLAWGISDGRYAISYGDNGQTNYDVFDDADDLACWLESPDVYGFDRALQTANVRGVDALPPLDEAAGIFRVLCTRHFYGPSSVSTWEVREDQRELEFDNLEEATEYVTSCDSATYVLGHNESGRPEYTIVGC